MVDDILEKYPNDVKVVIKNFPLGSHKQARKAAQYALAAHKQGKYKEMYHKIFDDFKPDAVINSAAMADVDLCEDKKEQCWEINVNGVKNLIRACKMYDSHLVHISTDYIFDGTKEGGLYTEEDTPNPQGYYAKSKLEGENTILASDISHSILRTILVYGKHKNHNIVTFVKENLEKGQNVNLVDDQVRMPTFVDDLAGACIVSAERRAKGIFNVCGPEQMSYLEIGSRIAKHFSLDTNLINHVKTRDLKQKAKRPYKTGFDLSKSSEAFSYSPTGFNDSLDLIF
mgnify:CR=1 FL=1